MPRGTTNASRQTRRVALCERQRTPRAHEISASPETAMLAARGHEVAEIATSIAADLGFSAEAIDHLRFAGLFHDIGKLWISPRILEKDGPLTHSEWTEVRKHPQTGALMLRAYGLDQEAEWVLSHHERPDGLGYPQGLRGDEIPIESRILAIADAWSAMRAHRPYSGPVRREDAQEELRSLKGEQFDSMLVDVFLDSVEPELQARLEASEREIMVARD